MLDRLVVFKKIVTRPFHKGIRFSITRSFLLIGLISLIFPHQVLAEDHSNLRVIVHSDEDNNPVIGANIILTAEADTLHTGVTNRDGYHMFRGIEARDYTISVSYIGYRTYQEEIELEGGETRNYRLSLEVEPEELEELVIEVAGGTARRTAGRQRISTAEISRVPSPGPGGDLASYLQTMPGVVTAGDRGGEFHFRGGTPAQNKILVDGIPVVKPFHISNLFSAFPERSVESVDLFAGGFSAEYLGATSSVLDVNLRPGNMQEFSGEAAISPYLTTAQLEGPLEEGRQSFLASFRHSTIEQFGPHVTGDEMPMRFYDFTGRYTIREESISCNVTGMNTYDRGRINPERDIRLSWSNTAIGGRCLAFSERLDYAYDIGLGYSGYRNREFNREGETERDAGIHRVYMKVKSERQFFGHSVDYGINWNMANHYAEFEELFQNLETFDDVYSTLTAYLGTQWRPFDQLRIEPSFGSQLALRQITNPTVEPRLRVSWNPAGNQNREFSLAVGRYYQIMEGITNHLDAGTVFYAWKLIGASDNFPMTDQAIFGYQEQLLEGVEFNVEGYVKEHQHLPIPRWRPEAGMSINTTTANGISYGVDTRLEINRFPFYLFLGYDWSKITYEAATESLGAWIDGEIYSYSPAHDRRHQFNVVSSYELFDFTTSISWELSSGNPFTKIQAFDVALTNLPDDHPLDDPGIAHILYDQPYDGRLPAYHRLDISIERPIQIGPHFELITEIGGINIYDRRNVFYFDSLTMQRVDQTPVFPYLSITAVF